jgi:hypothetical protein
MNKHLLAGLGASFMIIPGLAMTAIACDEGPYRPRATQSGDFTQRNANVRRISDDRWGTWDQWNVVSRDGELNCRATPNGRIVKVYRTGKDQVFATRTSDNAIQTLNGSPWLLTRDRCYVRANSQYIQPI